MYSKYLIKAVLLIIILFLFWAEINAQNSESLYSRADSLYDKELYQDAILIYNEIIRIDSDDAVAYNRRGNCYNSLEMNDSSLIDYFKAIEIDSFYSSPYSNIGQIYVNEKKYSIAESYLMKSHELSPDSAYIYGLLGYFFLITENIESSLYYYKAGLKIDSNIYYANYYLSIAYMQKGYTDKALFHINKSIKKYPEEIGLLRIRAEIYLEMFEYEKSIIDCKKVLEKEVDDIATTEILAQAYYETGDFESAYKESKNIIGADTSSYVALYILSEYFLSTNNYEMSLLYAEKGIINYPENSMFCYLKGAVFHNTGKYDKANLSFESAILKDSNNINLYGALIQNKLIHSSLKELNKKKIFKDISQEEMKVLYKEINKKNGKYSYKVLQNKILNDCSTLTLKEYFLLYLGRTQQKGFSGYFSGINKEGITDAYDKKEYEKCIKLCLSSVKNNPSSIVAYHYTAMSYYQTGDLINFIKYLTAYYGFLEGISATGDGLTAKTAYIVTSVDDEYQIMYYIGYTSEGQALMNQNGHNYDKLMIKSSADKNDGIWFNIDSFFGKF